MANIGQFFNVLGCKIYSEANQTSHSQNLILQEREFTAYVSAGPPEGKSLVYDRHMYYIDVERYMTSGDEGGDNATTVVPNWFNFVRHPVRRFESDFYYLRSAKRWKGAKSNRPNKVRGICDHSL